MKMKTKFGATSFIHRAQSKVHRGMKYVEYSIYLLKYPYSTPS